MASYLKPRRGKKSTAISQNIILKRGEVFFECPDTGVGTGIGKIKVGDGVTTYSSLPYFLDLSSGMGDMSKGDKYTPVYFSKGKPVACEYSLNKTVPSDAKFTDTDTTYSIEEIDGSAHLKDSNDNNYPIKVDWSYILNKPSAYVPTAHAHTKEQISNFPSSMPASDVYGWAKAKEKPSYSWNEIESKPNTFNPSSHSHSWSEITSKPESMPASDVYNWAKASTKPSYTWDEITDKPDKFPPASHTTAWNSIIGVPKEFPPAGHFHDAESLYIGDVASGQQLKDRIIYHYSVSNELYNFRRSIFVTFKIPSANITYQGGIYPPIDGSFVKITCSDVFTLGDEKRVPDTHIKSFSLYLKYYKLSGGIQWFRIGESNLESSQAGFVSTGSFDQDTNILTVTFETYLAPYFGHITVEASSNVEVSISD